MTSSFLERRPWLDRLLYDDDDPDDEIKAVASMRSRKGRSADDLAAVGADTAALRDSIGRDLQELLNTRRPWRPLPEAHAALRRTILGYGLPDFTSGAFNTAAQREALLSQIATAIADFEPRLKRARIGWMSKSAGDLSVFRLAIAGAVGGNGDPARLNFETLIDSATTDMRVKPENE